MKKIYDIACFTSDWKNDEAEELTMWLETKMYDYFEDKEEALDWFNGRFDFLKNNWLKKWVDWFAKNYPNITIGAELYETEVEDDFDINEDDFDRGWAIKTLYFCEGK